MTANNKSGRLTLLAIHSGLLLIVSLLQPELWGELRGFCSLSRSIHKTHLSRLCDIWPQGRQEGE